MKVSSNPRRNRVNLDITTLITLVSHVTNDLDPEQHFDDPVLQYQASEERQDRVLPKITEFMKDKEVIVTNTAWTKVSCLQTLSDVSQFQSIVSVVGGAKEKERAEELCQKIRFVEDHPSDYSKQLPLGSKIKQQHIDIFGSGTQRSSPK